MSPLQTYWTYVKFLCDRYKEHPQLVTTTSVSSTGSPRMMESSEVSIADVMDNGYREYAGVEWVWRSHNFVQWKEYTGRTVTKKATYVKFKLLSNKTGIIAIWMLALHEFAHVLDKRPHRKRDRRHDTYFANILAQLINDNPYEEFLDVINWRPEQKSLPPETSPVLGIDAILAKYKQP